MLVESKEDFLNVHGVSAPGASAPKAKKKKPKKVMITCMLSSHFEHTILCLCICTRIISAAIIQLFDHRFFLITRVIVITRVFCFH